MKYLLESIAKLGVPPDRDKDLKRLIGFQHSGFNLINEVNALRPEAVLDAGCGHNFFKGKIDNLIGLDVVDHGTNDMTISVQDATFENNMFDVILALGNLTYDTREEIMLDLAQLVKWLKPGGHLIVRARLHQFQSDEHWFQWQGSDIGIFSDIFNLQLTKGPVLDQNNEIPGLQRYCWWWRKM